MSSVDGLIKTACTYEVQNYLHDKDCDEPAKG